MRFEKTSFIVLSLIIFIQTGFGQTDNLPVLPKSAANLEGFVPAGWKIAQQFDDDLNSDGTTETILVLKGDNKELIKESEFLDFNSTTDEKTGKIKFVADNNPVILAVLTKEKVAYRLIAQNNQIIPLFVDSWYRWNYSVSVENKTLKVELKGKVSSGIRDNFGETKRVYRFQIQNSQLILTEAEETSWFQAMLVRNGRQDSYKKFDFMTNKGFMISTISSNKTPSKTETHKIENLIPFENISADSVSKLQDSAKIETNENFAAPSFTAEEISRRVLQLIKSIKTAEQISPQTLEKMIGGKVIFDEENRERYGYAGKISNKDWFYQIFSLTELNGEKSRRLEFSFERKDDKEDDLTAVCGFTYNDFKNELTKSGFTVKPFYGEHGRLLYWEFEKGKVEVKVKTYKYEKNECVKTLWINTFM